MPYNAVYSVPGPLNGNDQYTRVFYNEQSGNGTIFFYNTSDDTPYFVTQGDFTELRIIAIEAQIGTPGGKGVVNTMAKLKAAGVDTSDYYSVAEYSGLD